MPKIVELNRKSGTLRENKVPEFSQQQQGVGAAGSLCFYLALHPDW